jgi:hypothetical protein
LILLVRSFRSFRFFRPLPPRIHEVLQQHRGGQRIHIPLAAPGGTALLPDGGQGAGGAHAFVPELERQAGPPSYRGSHFARGGCTFLFASVGGKWETHDNSNRLVQGGELE